MANPNIVNMSTIYGKTAFLAVTSSPISIVSNSVSSGKIYKINALYVSNVDGVSSATIEVDCYNGTTAYRLSPVGLSLDSTQGISLIDKSIYLEEGCSIRLKSSSSGDVEAICSYEEIS